MASRTIRTILALDGEAQYSNKIKQINSNLSVMKANLKLLTQETTLNGNSFKNNTEKLSQLKEAQTQLKSKMDVLKSAIADSSVEYEKAIEKQKKMISQYGLESEEAQKAAKAVTRCEQTYNNYRTQLINTEAEMQRLNNEQRQLYTNSIKVSDVLKSIGSASMSALKGSVSAVKVEFEALTKGFETYVKGLGATVGAVAAYSTKVGSDFESNMSSVQATLQLSKDAMSSLESEALRLGAQTKFSAAEAAEGMKMLAQSGMSESKILENMSGMIDLAAAAEAGLTDVTRMVASAVNTFGEDMNGATRDAGYFADVLAKASSDSNTNILEMGEAFQYASTVSSVLGFSFKDTALMIELMANKSQQGTRAGTALRSILTNLTAPTKAAAAQLEEFGLSSEKVVELGLAGTIETLKEKFAELDKVGQATAAKNIAGKNGESGLLAILTASDEEVSRLSENIENCTGAAREMARVKLDNLKGDFTILKSAAETLGDVIYKNSLSEGLRTLVTDATSTLDKFKAVEEGTTNNGFGSVIVDAGNKARKNISSFLDAVEENLPKITNLFNTAINEGLKTMIVSIPRILTDVAPNLIKGFKDALKKVRNKLPEIFEAIKTGLTGNTMIQDIIETFDIGTDIIMITIKGITDNLDKILEAGAQIVVGIVESVEKNIDGLIDAVFAIVDGIVKFFENTEALKHIAGASVTILTKLVDGICEHIVAIIPAVLAIIEAIGKAFMDEENFKLLVKSLRDMVIAISMAVIELLPQLFTAPLEIGKALTNGIKEIDWSEAVDDMLNDMIIETLAIIPKLVNKFKKIGTSIKDAIFGKDYVETTYSDAEATTSLDTGTFGAISNATVAPTTRNVSSNLNQNVNNNWNINVYDAKNDIPTVVESTQQYIDSLRYGKGRY